MLNSPSRLSYPPSFAGDLAKLIYDTSQRPVKETAIAVALGLIAGICGRAFRIRESNLNLYILLVKQRCVDEECMSGGISNVVRAVLNCEPAVAQFIDFADYASAEKLNKAAAANASFVNVTREFPSKFADIAAGRTKPFRLLRNTMEDLYDAPDTAYTLLAETTPGLLSETLTGQQLPCNFLSTFTMVEHTGERPPANRNMTGTVPEVLISRIVELCHSAGRVLHGKLCRTDVSMDPGVVARFDQFFAHCELKANECSSASLRWLWNRAHLKALRVAANLAAADNCRLPNINIAHADWALELELRGIDSMSRSTDAGRDPPA